MSVYNTMKRHLVNTYGEDHKILFVHGSNKALINAPLSPEDAITFQQVLKEDGWFEVTIPGKEATEKPRNCPTTVTAVEAYLIRNKIPYTREKWYGCRRAEDILYPNTAVQYNKDAAWKTPRGYALFKIETQDYELYKKLPWVVTREGDFMVLAQAATYHPIHQQVHGNDVARTYYDMAYLCGAVKAGSESSLPELNALMSVVFKKDMHLTYEDVPSREDFVGFIHSLSMSNATSFGAAATEEEEDDFGKL